MNDKEKQIKMLEKEIARIEREKENWCEYDPQGWEGNLQAIKNVKNYLQQSLGIDYK